MGSSIPNTDGSQAETLQRAYLAATPYFDHGHPEVRRWADAQLQGCPDEPVAIACRLYLATRDQITYNPYVCVPDKATFAASYALRTRETYCIPKAVLLGAACRYKGIPSRLGLSDVKNHLSSPRLIEWLRTDIFHMHGYIELYLSGRWVKATPAFNSRLCELMGVAPLEFDGVNDSIFQPYANDGSAHMEYLKEYGTFADVPYDMIMDVLQSAYGHLFGDGGLQRPSDSLEREVAGNHGRQLVD